MIRGMDKKYKSSCWSIHGETRESTQDSGLQYETEAFDLFKTAFSMDEGGRIRRMTMRWRQMMMMKQQRKLNFGKS